MIPGNLGTDHGFSSDSINKYVINIDSSKSQTIKKSGLEIHSPGYVLEIIPINTSHSMSTIHLTLPHRFTILNINSITGGKNVTSFNNSNRNKYNNGINSINISDITRCELNGDINDISNYISNKSHQHTLSSLSPYHSSYLFDIKDITGDRKRGFGFVQNKSNKLDMQLECRSISMHTIEYSGYTDIILSYTSRVAMLCDFKPYQSFDSMRNQYIDYTSLNIPSFSNNTNNSIVYAVPFIVKYKYDHSTKKLDLISCYNPTIVNNTDHAWNKYCIPSRKIPGLTNSGTISIPAPNYCDTYSIIDNDRVVSISTYDYSGSSSYNNIKIPGLIINYSSKSFSATPPGPAYWINIGLIYLSEFKEIMNIDNFTKISCVKINDYYIIAVSFNKIIGLTAVNETLVLKIDSTNLTPNLESVSRIKNHGYTMLHPSGKFVSLNNRDLFFGEYDLTTNTLNPIKVSGAEFDYLSKQPISYKYVSCQNGSNYDNLARVHYGRPFGVFFNPPSSGSKENITLPSPLYSFDVTLSTNRVDYVISGYSTNFSGGSYYTQYFTYIIRDGVLHSHNKSAYVPIKYNSLGEDDYLNVYGSSQPYTFSITNPSRPVFGETLVGSVSTDGSVDLSIGNCSNMARALKTGSLSMILILGSNKVTVPAVAMTYVVEPIESKEKLKINVAGLNKLVTFPIIDGSLRFSCELVVTNMGGYISSKSITYIADISPTVPLPVSVLSGSTPVDGIYYGKSLTISLDPVYYATRPELVNKSQIIINDGIAHIGSISVNPEYKIQFDFSTHHQTLIGKEIKIRTYYTVIDGFEYIDTAPFIPLYEYYYDISDVSVECSGTIVKDDVSNSITKVVYKEKNEDIETNEYSNQFASHTNPSVRVEFTIKHNAKHLNGTPVYGFVPFPDFAFLMFVPKTITDQTVSDLFYKGKPSTKLSVPENLKSKYPSIKSSAAKTLTDYVGSNNIWSTGAELPKDNGVFSSKTYSIEHVGLFHGEYSVFLIIASPERHNSRLYTAYCLTNPGTINYTVP